MQQREIKFRLVRDGKIVGYERHKFVAGLNLIRIQHSRRQKRWWDIEFTRGVDHDKKDSFIMIDNDGVDIYECDIVEVIEAKNIIGKEKKLYVKWNNKCCCLDWYRLEDDEWDGSLSQCQREQIRKIGNIYEQGGIE